jgi:hypothetical protein
VFGDGHGVAVDLVFQAELMLGVGGDPLAAPALEVGEVGVREIRGHGEQAISLTTPREGLRDRQGRGRAHEVPFM